MWLEIAKLIIPSIATGLVAFGGFLFVAFRQQGVILQKLADQERRFESEFNHMKETCDSRVKEAKKDDLNLDRRIETIYTSHEKRLDKLEMSIAK